MFKSTSNLFHTNKNKDESKSDYPDTVALDLKNKLTLDPIKEKKTYLSTMELL